MVFGSCPCGLRSWRQDVLCELGTYEGRCMCLAGPLRFIMSESERPHPTRVAWLTSRRAGRGSSKALGQFWALSLSECRGCQLTRMKTWNCGISRSENYEPTGQGWSGFVLPYMGRSSSSLLIDDIHSWVIDIEIAQLCEGPRHDLITMSPLPSRHVKRNQMAEFADSSCSERSLIHVGSYHTRSSLKCHIWDLPKVLKFIKDHWGDLTIWHDLTSLVHWPNCFSTIQFLSLVQLLVLSILRKHVRNWHSAGQSYGVLLPALYLKQRKHREFLHFSWVFTRANRTYLGSQWCAFVPSSLFINQKATSQKVILLNGHN